VACNRPTWQYAQTSFVPDVELNLVAAPATLQIIAGVATRVWRYTGSIIKGPPGTLQTIDRSYLGPTIRLQTGQKVRVHFTNHLPEPTIVHWHGMDVPSEMDGHPRRMISSGQTYLYEFEVLNRAGTYWYHPHHHERTGPQVYRGLAGLLVVSDREETGLRLPSGADEIVCVLQDRTFDANNQLVYVSDGPMEAMSGFLGQRVLVNGQAPSAMSLGTRVYRVRFLNGSNSRVYKLAWDNSIPMMLIGTDGGLLERPRQQAYLTLAPGERADVIFDLSQQSLGTIIRLRSLSFSTVPFEIGMRLGMGRGGRMGRGQMRPSVENGAPISILEIHVERRESSNFTLPSTLSSFDGAWNPENNDSAVQRVVSVGFRQMRWTLNGRIFEMQGVAPDEIVKAGSKVVWEFDNTQPGMMGMQLAHPLHLHGRQFRILSRRTDRTSAGNGESLREGFTDYGWKDTVLVMPGERVRVLVKFTHYPGLYLYHCHNLEHEDMGMMRNYRVIEP
jgi:FtsP/CotA-like multicopper oxidase with cupredoxin domain